MVVTLFGKRQTIEFTALARPRCSGATIPMRNESPIGADMFIKAARTIYRPAAARAFVTNARLNMKTVERPWAMTMARTGPYRFARDALTVAAGRSGRWTGRGAGHSRCLAPRISGRATAARGG